MISCTRLLSVFMTSTEKLSSYIRVSPSFGISPNCSTTQPPTVADSVSISMSNRRSSFSISARQLMRHAFSPAGKTSSSTSSSSNSPTICTRRSLIVTMPCVPPYSSKTTAKLLRFFFMLRNRMSAFMLSGTKNTSRTASFITFSRERSVRRRYIFALSTPMMLSMLSSQMG